MDILQAVLLGLLQGVTEFVPVSSSGHLVLAEEFLGLHVEGLLSFDVVLHAGTLVALVAVFWKKIWSMLLGDYKTLAKLFVATLPAVVFGLLFKDMLEEYCRGVLAVAVAFMCVGVVFLVVGYLATAKTVKPTWKQVVLMGLAQAVALVPGVSRSGMTVATGEMSGLRREEAAEFSFLMLLPVVLGAIVLVFAKGETEGLPGGDVVLAGFLASAISSFLVAKGMLRFFRHFGLKVFGYYLLVIGGVLVLSRYI